MTVHPEGTSMDMESRLVVLGSSAAWPEPDRHPDHMVDLHALYRARSMGGSSSRKIPVYGPPGVVERVKALEEDDGAEVDGVFDGRHLLGEDVSLGPWRLSSEPVAHTVPTVGVRLVSDGVTIAHTGDSGPSAALVELGRDADLFIVEATQEHQQDPAMPQETETHLTAQQAGRVAHEVGARRLLLTHFWPGNDRNQSRADAAEAYDGEIVLAEEGLEVLLR